jgi:hypothetical protein
VKQPVGDRGEDLAPGFAASQVDPCLGALSEDNLRERLPQQGGLRGVEVDSDEFLLVRLPASLAGDEGAAGHGNLEELGGR